MQGLRRKFPFDIQVRVTVNAKKNFIKEENGKYKVYITAPAREGRANQELISFLAEHFQVKRNQIWLLCGEKSREKIIRIHSLS